MEDPLHILIVGHNLQAKCDVANAFIKQKSGFKQFNCRQNLLVKKIVGAKSTQTVAGRQLHIVLTPNLNTPGWTHMNDGIISKYTNRVFVYVKAPGLVRVNDDESIKNIKEKFRKPNVQLLTYYERKNEADQSKHEDLYLHAKMPFKEKISSVDKVLAEIGRALQSNVKIEYRGPQEVGNTSVAESSHRPQSSLTNVSGAGNDEETEHTLERQDTDQLELVENIEPTQWDLLTKTLRCGRAKSNHVRVNIIGNQGAGKTTLVLRLLNMEVKCPNVKQSPTEALEIKELSSRCIEINGEKKWDTNIGGYIEDLNVQRMAQAMKNAETGGADTSSEDINEEDFSGADYLLGSNIEEDIEVVKQEPYTAINREQSRVRYMKNILRKKNHSRGERMYVSYWDFAGQSTYYSTHQVFMSPSAVYVLVVDLSRDFKEKLSDSLHFRTGIIKDCSIAESLMFWISSIKAFTTDLKGGRAPVLIVGTHVDKVRQRAEKKSTNVEDEINKKFKEVREILKMSEIECIAVDNTDPDISDLLALRNRILELGLGVIDEEIPAQWIDLERMIQEQRIKGTVLMSYDELKKLDENMDVPMRDNARLDAFLGHQHNRGHLIHFLHNDLKDLIILEPDVLAKFLNNLMRSRDIKDQEGMEHHSAMYNHNGIINQNYVTETAKMMSEHKGVMEHVDKLLKMLVHLSVIRPYKHYSDPGSIRYLLPCLLPHRAEEDMNKADESVVETRNFLIEFQNNHMPPTFYHIFVGGLLNEWQLIEKSVDIPEIYNLYACFRLDAETRQMEVYWKESSIHIDIKNYSTKKKLQEDKIFEILETVQKRIVKIFRIYRHTNTHFQIRVQCPEHTHSFVSLAPLKRDEEAMCYYGNGKHAVEFETVFGKKLLKKERSGLVKRRPTDIDLGRLALYLVREDATSLASRLCIHLGLVEADRAAQNTSDKNSRRMYILYQWRGSNGSATVGDLIELLTVTKDYQTETLEKLLGTTPQKQNYDIPGDKIDCIPQSKSDLKIACNKIGALYPFLMLELGLCFTDVEVARANNRDDMWQITFTLLSQWRQQHPQSSTTRTLLDTASFVGIDTTQMQNEIWKS